MSTLSSETSLRFDGQVVVVTGAGRGIGRAHALAFARRGASVVVNDLGAEPDGLGGSRGCAQDVVAEIEDFGGTAVASFVSVADASAAEIIDHAISHFGRLDVLVNNAGNQLRQLILDCDETVFRRHLDVHLLGTYRLCRAAWPQLTQSKGRIVNTLSGLLLGMEGYAAYAAAKGGIFALSKTLAVEGRDAGIRVNCVIPGAATRLMTAGLPPEVALGLERAFPASAVAEVVVYLTHRSCELHGENIAVNGNRVSRYVLAETRGIKLGEMTAETVSTAISTILDPADLTIWTDTVAAMAGVDAGDALAGLPQTSVLTAEHQGEG